MKSSRICTTLASALLTILSTSAASAQDITVSGARERVVGRAFTGADIVEHSATVPVSLRDLDLETAAGWRDMEERVSVASRLACDTIRQQNPIGLRDNRYSCASKAYADAIARIHQISMTSR